MPVPLGHLPGLPNFDASFVSDTSSGSKFNWQFCHGRPVISEVIQFEITELQTWDDIISAMVGYRRLTGEGELDDHEPYYHPLFTDYACTGLSGFRGIGGHTDVDDTGLANFGRWECTATFEVLPYLTSGTDAYQETIVVPTVEFVTFSSGNKLKWTTEAPSSISNTPIPPDIVPGLRLPAATLLVRWHMVPMDAVFDPSTHFPDLLFSSMGKVNKQDWGSYDAGTLLFEPPKLTRITLCVAANRLGDATSKPFAYIVEYPLVYKPNGWNKLPTIISNKLQYYEATYDATPVSEGGVGLYPAVDFNSVICVPFSRE